MVGWVAVSAAVATLAGCGLRVGSQQVHAATQAAMGSGTGGIGAPGGGNLQAGTNGGSSSQEAASLGNGSSLSSSGSSGATTGGASSGGTSTGGGANTPTGGASTGATGSSSGSAGGTTGAAAGGGCPAATGSAPGLTASTITIGNVSDLSGPVPGLFQGGPYGTQAYIDYINSQGGVCGRQLKMISSDDALSCSSNESDYQNLVGQVFAFVGSWSLDDNCGAQIMKDHPNVPIIQQSLSTQFQNLPNSFSEGPYQAGEPNGPFLYFKQKFPDAVGSVGTIVGNQPSAVQSWQYFKHTLQATGYTIKYEDDVPPTQTNFTADIIRMRQAGIKFVFLVALNAPDVADVSQEAAQQGWKPEVFDSPVAYFGQYISQSGGASAVEGQWIPAVDALFLGEDAGVLPEVANFSHWIKTAYPSFPIDQFAASSWAQTALFVHVLQQAGPNQAAILKALSQTGVWNDYGMTAPAQIGTKSPAPCYVLLQIHGGKYVKVDDPPGGPTNEYRCDGQFIPYG